MRQPSADQAAKLTGSSLRDICRVLDTPSYHIFPDWLVFCFIPVIVVAYLIGGYYVILAPGNLYNAIVSEDWLLFRAEISKFALVATAVIIVKVFRGVIRESAANILRLRLTRALHRNYFGSSSHQPPCTAPPFYRLVTEETKVDNPDQRIVADARDFSISFFGILAGGKGQGSDSGGLLEGVISIVFYSQKTLLRTGWYGVCVAYLWSIIVALVTVFVINRTSPVVFRQEKLEADFRYSHAELRRSAEEVAFLRGSNFEKHKLAECLDLAVSNAWVVIFRHMYLNFVQYGFGYYVSIIMYLAIALAIHQNLFESAGNTFSSNMTPGEKAKWISQTGGIFIQLLYSFTMMIQLGTAISEFISNSERVAALLKAFRDFPGDIPMRGINPDTEPLIHSEEGTTRSRLYCSLSDGISVRDLVVSPNENSRIGPVSFSIATGQCVLLEGPTGSGKTSVLRVIRGLWNPSSGTILVPSDEKAIMFAPQIPYISTGFYTLRQLVKYPHKCLNSRSETDRIISALNAVGWRHNKTAQKLDVKENWSRRLSPGEAQLIAAARVLVAKPAFVFLDEPTSSLDVAGEERVFQAFKHAGVTGLTVGHSRSLRSFHDRIVSLNTG